jgi:hypothetical protein
VAAKRRTGAPTWAKIMREACKLTHFPGFWLGLQRISTPEFVATIQPLWEACCVAIEAYMSSDDYPFQVDGTVGDELQDG